jgi:PTH1 family peptidyl-tRNA hydrolase
VVRTLAKDLNIKIGEESHHSLVGRGRVAGRPVILALPQTYMNLSGKAVSGLLSAEVRLAEEMLVICDDINLTLGRIRLRKNGSSGGHKGLASIIAALRTDAFARLRVGIATEVHKGDITGYVLSPFRRKERRNASHAIDLAVKAAMTWVTKGMDEAMNRFNKAKTGAS